MSHDPNFLEHEAQSASGFSVYSAARHPMRVPRWLKILLGILAVWLVVVGAVGIQTTLALLDVRDRLTHARDAMTTLDIASAQADLTSADSRLALAERGLGLLQTLSVIPWARAQVGAIAAAATSGRRVLSTIRDLTDLGAEFLRLSDIAQTQIGSATPPSASFKDLPTETKRTVLRRLAASADDVERASTQIAIARADLAMVPADEIVSPILEALRPLDAKLSELQETLHILSVASRLLPAFAGVEGDRTTLLLFLNNAELRPGGGFIGSYGLLTMRDGDITSLATHDVYALDHPAEPYITLRPPAALSRYNATDRFMFRDANWSPDFAVDARTLLERYQAQIQAVPAKERVGVLAPVTIQNVAGVTPTFLSDLLRLVGPVQAGGQTFTADNVFDTLEYQVEYGYVKKGIPEEQRKELLAALVKAVQEKLYVLPASRWGEAVVVLERGLSQKQVALYSVDQPTEDAIVKFGWAGRVSVPPRGEDTVMFVDANLAALKSDPVVERSITYGLRFNNSRQLVATASVRYAHHGTFDWKTSRYRSYVRLYVPEGSRLVSTTGSLADDKTHNPSGSPGATDVSTDLGFTVFGTFVAVEPGETRDLTFEYLLPDTVSAAAQNGAYRLAIFKQLGAAARALTLTLAFGKTLVSADPPEASVNWGDGTYFLHTMLDQDRVFSVGL